MVRASDVTADNRPRVIIVTDIGTEPDDIESMVRLLTYANEIDIEGLIAATSRHMPDRVRPDLIEKRVAAYGEVLGNLRIHDPRYPDAATLKSRIRAWHPQLGMAGVGAGKANEASQLIIDAVDKADTRPVWVSIWGGATPLAQALWTVQSTRSPEDAAKFVSKLRVYSISDQDDAGPWARATFPHLFWIASIHGPTQYELAAWTGISAAIPGADQSVVDRRWLTDNIRNKGPLGALYPLPMFIMEGDTPSFLNLIDNGLSVPERPDWGGWGGRWEQPSPAFGLWTDTLDSATGTDGKQYRSNKATIWRWREAFQNDFAARMAWSVAPRFKDANHAPHLVLNGAAGTGPVTIAACPGAVVNLSSAGSSDPDGQPLAFRWWQYREPTGLYSPDLKLAGENAPQATVTIPQWTEPFRLDAPPVYQFHFIMEVRDTGTPALIRYRRAILEVPTDGRSVNGTACTKVAMMADPGAVDFDSPVVPSSAAWSVDSEIGALIDNPATKAVLVRSVPHVVEAASSNLAVSNFTLRGLSHFMPGLPREKLAEIDAELAKVPAK